MSSDWWLNNIGSAAAATTPSGSVPQYGVAYDVGTAAWPDAQSFNDYVSAEVSRTHGKDVAAIAAAKKQDDEGWFQKRLAGVGHATKRLVGDNSPVAAIPILGTYLQAAGIGDDSESDAEIEKRGAERLHAFGQAPVVKQLNDAYNIVSNVLETPFIMDKNVGIAKDFGLWTDKSAWGRAWREADERTIAQAIADDVLTGTQGVESDADLDRIRRTNSLYGMTTFAGDLYAGFKLDPTVFAGKGLGEARGIALGKLPAETSALKPEALRTARGEAPAKTVNPVTRYASYRGRRVAVRFDDLRDYARTHTLTDMTALPMFRRQAVNGPQAALAFKIAANDDTLWDLTQRAVLADPVAWREIGELKHSVPADIRAYAPGDTQTYLDAIDATKSKMKQLETEVNDLEKTIAARAAGPRPLYPDRPTGGVNPGFFEHYTWELHRDLASKKADVAEMARKLEAHEDYGTWLSKMPHVYGEQDWYAGPVTSIDQVSTKAAPLDFLSQHTYQASAYGATHQVSQIAKAGWMLKANPIDLNRVDSGVESIRRQFEQFDHLLGYKNPEGLESALDSFVRAPDQFERFKIAKQIEDEHLIGAISQKFGLDRNTVDLFLDQTRLRKNDMMNALLSGEGAVYSTGSMMDTATILKREKGMAEIEVVDNGIRRTMRVPEEALQPQTMPVDPTQTPNMYLPMDTRQVYLAVKRNNELFEALDEDVRNFGAKHTAKTMEGINSLGTAFNALWKPVQLFRLAWPQRVIMDEGLRALALVGSNMFARNFGAAARDAALNAVNPLEHGILPWRERRKFKAGPGPVTDGIAGRGIDTPSHEELVQDAPFVPSYYAPQLNKERADLLYKQLAAAEDIQRVMDRNAALLRNPNRGVSLPAGSGEADNWYPVDSLIASGPIEGTPFDLTDLAKARDVLGDGPNIFGSTLGKTELEFDLQDPELPAILGERADTSASYTSRAERLVRLYGIGGPRRAQLEHAIEEGRNAFDQEVAHRKTGAGHRPLFQVVYRRFNTREAQRDLLIAKELGAEWAPGEWATSMFHDASTSLREQLPKAVHAGPAVEATRRILGGDFSVGPIERVTETIDATTGRPARTGYAVPVAEVAWSGHVKELHAFMAEHKELLASQGYRLQLHKERGIEPAKTLRVVRVFRSNEMAKATDFADHVGSDGFISLHEGNKHYVRDWNDRSPIMEELDRRFWNREQEELTPGAAPTEGEPAVYHGSPSELPGDLRPREDVPVAHGNMVGQGFYTTTDLGIASSYGTTGLYTIRSSKTGKVYETFDMDQPMSRADKDQLAEYMLDHYNRVDPDAARIDPNIAAAVNEVEQATTWLEIMAQLENWWISTGRGSQPQQLVTRFLEEERNAGALTHEGGVRTGGKRHQVYVWLHPEDLEVRPAYRKTGKFESLEGWFDNPDSLERLYDDPSTGLLESRMEDVGKVASPVPENRIHRTGLKPRAAARHLAQEQGRLDMSPANEEMHGRYADLQLNTRMDSIHEAFLRRLLKRRQYGRGTSTWKSADGQRVVAHNALEGPGEVYTPLISSNPVYSRMTDTYKRTLSKYREKAAGYKSTPPPDVSREAMATTAGRQAAVDYYTSWADLLNEQVRNSPIWYRMLEGQSDGQIVHWLTSTDEGARLRKELPHMGHRPEKWVEEHRQRLNAYLPDKNLQALAKDRPLQPSELRRVPAEMMPTIYEPDLQMISGRGEVAKFISDHVERIYHALGTVPSDLLVRQPFFKSMYDLKMRNLIAASNSAELSNGVLRGYEKLSREFALRQVKKNLYDLADETNFTQAVRFLAPFWGAQQEAMVKWFNIAIEKPETVAKFYVGVNQTYNRLQVIDENGKPTKSPGNLLHYNPNDRVILQIPKNLTKVAPFDKLLGEFGSIGVAFGAANTAFQGDNPMIPSLGPIVTIPVDKLVNAMWDTHGTQFDDNFFYRWLFPVGRPEKGIQGTLDQMFPGWGRRLTALQQGQDSRSYANTYWSVYRELDLDHRKRGLPPPTPQEVDSATKWHFGLRVLASFAAPAAMEFRPKHQMFLDEYHKMQELYGPDAFEKFVQKFGADAARYAASSSNSPVGIPPTAQGMEDWEQNKALIQKFPNWGGAIVSPDAWTDDFSSDAYGAQFDIKLGPGTRKTLREINDPTERANQTDVRLGWLQYRQFMSGINAELYKRGLNSLQEQGAEDLQQIKDQYTADLQEKLPAWAEDFHNFSDTIYSRMNELQSFAFDKQFDNRPDIQGVRQYLILRDAAARSLDSYAASTGGSRSLQAQENGQLRDWFYGQVGALIQQNPAFGEFYSRYLESDRLERGSGP